VNYRFQPFWPPNIVAPAADHHTVAC
jgi:hypothetical protein